MPRRRRRYRPHLSPVDPDPPPSPPAQHLPPGAWTLPVEPTSPLPIATFRDALTVVLELSDRFRFVHTAIVLDASHLVLDLTAFTDPTVHTIAGAVAWSGELLRRPVAEKLLLCSIDRTIGARFVASDRTFYARLSETAADAGIEVLDWIRGDGERFRSLAFATDPHHAWPGDPLAERLANLAMMAEHEHHRHHQHDDHFEPDEPAEPDDHGWRDERDSTDDP